MPPNPAYATKHDEFWYNVSNQEDLPIAGQIEIGVDLEAISSFFKSVARAPNEEAAIKIVGDLLLASPSVFNDVRRFLGISDKRAYLELSYIASRTAQQSQHPGLCGCYPWTLSRHPTEFFLGLVRQTARQSVAQSTAVMLAEYLVHHGLFASAIGFSVMHHDVLQMLYTRLIAPKEYQQKAAKRRGHGCEAALAEVLTQLGVELLPEDKARNPMGSRDPNVDLNTMLVAEREAGSTYSFDMLIMREGMLRVAIQSLIHTSDPGQYGVNKSDETVTVIERIKTWRADKADSHQVELWGLVDGVGFSENKPDTINKLLKHFDTFIQLRTLYKAALRLHELKLCRIKGIFFTRYYNAADIHSIASLYVPKDVPVLNHGPRTMNASKEIPCGEAVLYI